MSKTSGQVNDLHQVMIPAVQKIQQSKGHQSGGEAGYRQLWQHCLDNLEDLTKTPVQIPSHWTQDIQLSCNCADCKELQQFLLDPQEQVHRFRVRKDRRQHLHQQIDRHGGDMSHVTERRGSPQTLICTKNRASYERKQQHFEVDTQLLTELRVLAEA
jgi:hypothetical protein